MSTHLLEDDGFDQGSDLGGTQKKPTVPGLTGKADKSALDAHIADQGNPHKVTKSQVGLDKVDNTSDANKPVSAATQAALNTKPSTAYVNDQLATRYQKPSDGIPQSDLSAAVQQKLDQGGSATGGQALTKTITQSGHGFSVGQAVRYDGSQYVKAQADNDDHGDVDGVVISVAGPAFTIHINGLYEGYPSGLPLGYLYLSADTAGALTATEPNNVGQVSKPVLHVVGSGAAYFVPYRGAVVGAPLTKSDVGLGNVPNIDATNRSNHIGAQSISTVSGLQSSLDALSGLRSVTLTVATSQSGLMADIICNNNVNDQTTTTQTIINQALASFPNGGVRIFFRSGIYYIKTPGIKVPSYCTLDAEPGAIFVYANGSAYTGLIRNANATIGGSSIVDYDIVIQNAVLQGNSVNAGGNPPRDMLWLQGVSGFWVSRNKLTDSSDSGIVLDVGTEWGTVDHNTIVGAADIGIYLSDPNNCSIAYNTVRNTSSYGIRTIRRLANSGQYNDILANRIDNCGQAFGVDGIMVDAADLTTVNLNRITRSGRNGINLQAAYFTCAQNFVDLSDRFGIYVDGGSRGAVTGNTIHRSSAEASNTYSGIGLHNANDVSVVGNRSGDSGSGTRQKYGIVEEGTSDSNTISGNTLDRNGTAGLLSIGANSVIGLNRE